MSSNGKPLDQAARMAGVVAAAHRLDLLDEEGRLQQLDSLNVLDMVLELERQMAIEIPTAAIRMEHFESLDTLRAWVEQLVEK